MASTGQARAASRMRLSLAPSGSTTAEVLIIEREYPRRHGNALAGTLAQLAINDDFVGHSLDQKGRSPVLGRNYRKPAEDRPEPGETAQDGPA